MRSATNVAVSAQDDRAILVPATGIPLSFGAIFFSFSQTLKEVNFLTLHSTSQSGTNSWGQPRVAMVTLNLPTGRNVAIRSMGASQVQQGNSHNLGRCARQDGSPPHSPRLF